jgi:4-hydroxybenzoate polyprenyltransferase
MPGGLRILTIMHRSVVAASAAKAVAGRYMSCLRREEVLVLQGPPLLGAAFALGQSAVDGVVPLTILLAGNLCLVAHIFVLNDWSNLETDLADPDKAEDVFTARGVGRNEMGVLASVLLGISLLLCSRLGATPLCLALGIAALSALYSTPGFNWKGRPLLNSAAHLGGGVLHFLLGYSLGGGVDGRGLAISSFFAVTFAAGHLTQEIRDHDGDVRNAIRTNAVAFGRRRTFFASLGLFTVSYALLFFLALHGTLHRDLAWLVVLYPLHLGWSLQALGEGLTRPGICRLQLRYRGLYAGIGLAMAAALWLG